MSVCTAMIVLYCSTEAEKQLREKISTLSRIIHMSTIKSIKIDLLKSSVQVTLALLAKSFFSTNKHYQFFKLKNSVYFKFNKHTILPYVPNTYLLQYMQYIYKMQYISDMLSETLTTFPFRAELKIGRPCSWDPTHLFISE